MTADDPQRWFSTLGEPLGEAERADIDAYLAGLGIGPSLPTLLVESWTQAGSLTRSPAGSWWDIEEAERTRLEKLANLDPSDPEWLTTTDALHGAAALAAVRAGVADPGLVRAAAGAAAYATYQFRLTRAAKASPDHPFMRKYALFCGGRWPLGVYGERFAIF